jgi:hypothetical protein
VNEITVIAGVSASTTTTEQPKPEAPRRWRDILSIHPAAELFPLMGPADVNDVAEDIQKNGLREPVAIYQGKLLDGRNRLDALRLIGREIFDANGRLLADICRKVGDDDPSFDPAAYVTASMDSMQIA